MSEDEEVNLCHTCWPSLYEYGQLYLRLLCFLPVATDYPWLWLKLETVGLEYEGLCSGIYVLFFLNEV